MTWVSFDDGYTRERVWDGIPYDTRWHFHAIVELCCATRRYDGRLRWPDALRCSDVPDPARSVKELVTAGLLLDLGAAVEVENIDDFLPPEGQRAENLLARKRKNQAAYRRRKCERGEHDRHCPAATCPARVASRVTGNPGSGRDGTGSTKTEGRVSPWLPAEFAGTSADANDTPGARPETESEARRDSGGTTPAPAGVQASNSVALASEHNGSEPDGPDDQQIPIEVHLQSQATDRNAREACPVCGMKQRLRTNGKLARHGPKFTPCRGSGLTLTGTAS